MTCGDLGKRCGPENNSYLQCWYRCSAEWQLWYRVPATRNHDHTLEITRQTPVRTGSGVGFHVSATDSERLPRRLKHDAIPKQSAPPDPITLHFRYGDDVFTKTLAYHAFASWHNLQTLLKALSEDDDGIVIVELWDVSENMPIGSGDWDARVQPGWIVQVLCSHRGENSGWSCDDNSSDSSEDADGDEFDNDGDAINGTCVAERMQREHPWWFARWKRRVEKKVLDSARSEREPLWYTIVIWCMFMAGFIVLVSILGV